MQSSDNLNESCSKLRYKKTHSSSQSDDSDSDDDDEKSTTRELFYAIEKNNYQMVKTTLDTFKGDLNHLVNAQDASNYKNTPLHMAVKRRGKRNIDKDVNGKIIMLLLESNADVNKTDGRNKSPFDIVNGKLSKNPRDRDWQWVKDAFDHLTISSPTIARGIKRRTDSADVSPDKKPKRSDPGLDPEPTYRASGAKLFLDGTVYQSKLLALFTKRAIDKKYDFRLATEMDAAEKFDDVVLKVQDNGKQYYRFLQAKHKQDPRTKKITINDLISMSDTNPFSLAKYFVSYYKIKLNELFKGALFKDFIIITNTDFDFSENLQRTKKGDLYKKAKEKNTLINKWKSFFETEEDIVNDEILYIKSKDFKAVKSKFNDSAKEELTEIIKSTLLKCVLQTKEINNFTAIKEKLEVMKVSSLQGLILLTDTAVANINDRCKVKDRKKIVLNEAKKVLYLKDKILETEEYMALKSAINNLDMVPEIDVNDQNEIDDAVTNILVEANKIREKIKTKIQNALHISTNYTEDNTAKALALKNNKDMLRSVESHLKNIRANILEAITIDVIKKEIQKDVLRKRLSMSFINDIKKKINTSDVEEAKETLSKAIENMLSEIATIQVATDDNLRDQYLQEFLDLFRFVTNYPNEKELDAFTKRELGEKFRLLNADLVSDSFQREMLDFLKYYDKGNAKFYSWLDGEFFFRGLHDKIDSLMTAGLSRAYPESLRACGVSFVKNLTGLNHFLSGNNQLVYVRTQDTNLSAIKVLQTLESDEFKENFNYLKKKDGFIFIRLKTLVRKEIQNLVINSFSSAQSHYLLVIENKAKSQEKTEAENDMYERLSSALECNKNKKIIFISQDQDDKSFTCENECQPLSDKQICFKHLSTNTQNMILEKPVDVQGKEMKLNNFLTRDLATKIIDCGSLSVLIRETKFQIGDMKAFSSLGYVSDYYISRNLLRQFVDIQKCKRIIGSILLFVSGVKSKFDLTNLGFDEKVIYEWNNNQSYENGIVFVHEGDKAPEIFDILRQKKDTVIYWLMYDSGKLFHIKSNEGYIPLQYPLDFISEDLHESVFYSPSPDMNVVIVSNDSGMGKSTFLTSIANGMRNKAADWIVRINFQNFINTNSFMENGNDEAIDFVSSIVVPGAFDNNEIQLQRTLFAAGLRGDNQLRIIIQFDGFDEINPKYKYNTMNLIKALKGSNVTQIWISTRVHEAAFLQKELESSPFSLNPLTESDQLLFISNFWKWHCKFCEKNETICERSDSEILLNLREMQSLDEPQSDLLTEEISEIINRYEDGAIGTLNDLREAVDELDFYSYALLLLEQWNKSINYTEFTLIPLHLKMLTEVITRKKFRLPKDYGIISLYREFVKVKFDIYYREKGSDRDDTRKVVIANYVQDTSSKRDSKNIQRVHCELAVKLLFPEEHQSDSLPGLHELSRFTEDLDEGQRAEDELTRVGLLRLNSDQLQFIHRSFAEHFMSEYLIKHLQDERVQNLLFGTILMKNDYKLVCTMFDGHLENLKISPTGILAEVTKKELLKKLGIHYYLETPLHRIASEGYCQIYDLLMKNIYDNSELLEIMMTKTYNGRLSVFHLSIWGDHPKIVERLLNDSLKLDIETRNDNIFRLVRKEEGTPLILAAERGYKDVVEVILNFVKLYQNDIGEEFIKEFVLETDDEGYTAFSLAIDRGYDEVVKIILLYVKQHFGLETVMKLILKENSKSQTVLHLAVQNASSDLVDEILHSICDFPGVLNKLFTKTDFYGATVLREATCRDTVCKTFVTELLNNIHKYDTEDILCLTVYGDSREDLQIVVDNLLSVFKDGSIFYSKLHFYKQNLINIKEKRRIFIKAVQKNNINTMESILNDSQTYVKELILATEVKDNRTVLHVAADAGLSNVVEILLRFFCDYPRILEGLILKVQDSEDETALHRAARHGHIESVRLILNYVHNYSGKETLRKALLKRKNTGTSPIYAAHYRERHETVKLFLEFVECHVPDLLQNQVAEIGGMQVTIQWAEEKRFWDLQRLLLQFTAPQQKKIDLFKAAEEGNSTAIEAILGGAINDIKALKELLFACDDGGCTLLGAASGGACSTILNWVNNNLKEIPPKVTLKKLVFACSENKARDTNFLQWIKDNLESYHPNLLKKLLFKPFFQDKTALSSGFYSGSYKINSSLILLDWMKRSLDKETFEDVILASDRNGRTVLHSAAFDVEYNEKSEAVINLLKALTDHPEILKKLVLKSDMSDETILHRIARETHYRNDNNLLENKRFSTNVYTEDEGVSIVRALIHCLKDDSQTLRKLILATDAKKQTAMSLAWSNGNKKLYDVLKQLKEQVNLY